ncbi:peptidase associated/transthyretin-like domain-containing protein [Pseudomonas sp. Hz4]
MKAFRTLFTVTALAATLLTSGCASIVGDSKYPVNVSSTPSGANFTITNKAGVIVHNGSTPNTVTLPSGRGYFKGEAYTITFKKEGYADANATLETSMSGWYWGNIVFGGLIGMLVVDPLTGAMYKLPEGAAGNLGNPLAGEAPKNLTLLEIDQLSPSNRAALVRIN